MIAVRALAVVVGLTLLAGGCATSARHALDNADPSTSGAEQAKMEFARSLPLLESQGFAVLDFRVWRDEFSRVCVVGEVKNTGFAARAVELQATLRDENGRVVAVGHFYPASYRNIEPETTWPFAYSFGRQDQVARGELRIVGAFRTMDTVDFVSDAR